MFNVLDGSHMVATRPWIAFFSQTGSEIVEVSKILGRWPDRIITNKRPDHLRKINQDIPLHLLMWTENKPELHEYDWLMRNFDNPIVTLHGWLRVVPEDTCRKYEIYNGHPGLITKYPELKGKDPQYRAWEGNYRSAGCVIHKVTAGVDEGEVLMERESIHGQLPKNDIFRILHDTSVEMWGEFLQDKLWLDELH
jgi:formyltetrahydrofolate hydrolase